MHKTAFNSEAVRTSKARCGKGIYRGEHNVSICHISPSGISVQEARQSFRQFHENWKIKIGVQNCQREEELSGQDPVGKVDLVLGDCFPSRHLLIE